MTKSAVSFGFGHIYWRNLLKKTSFLVSVFKKHEIKAKNDLKVKIKTPKGGQWCYWYLFRWLWTHKTEVYLEPSQTSKREIFCKNNEQLKDSRYFRKKRPSQMIYRVLSTSLLSESNWWCYCNLEKCKWLVMRWCSV